MANKLIIGTEINTKSFEKQIEEVEYRLKQVDEELSHKKELKLDSRTIHEYEVEAEKLNNQLNDLYKKQAKINNQGFSNIQQYLENAGNSMTKIIKKVAKWSLAVISIRSVYLGIRSAMSTLTQSDDELSAKVDYMRWALATAIKPIIEWIIQAIYTILRLISEIIYTFTGYNIFKDSGIGNYEKAMKSSNKNAKELKKTLAGFDEMNVLNEDGSVGTKSGALPSPDLDLSNLNNYESGVKKVVDNLTKKWFDLGKDMKKALENPEAFDKAYGEWSMFMQGLVQFFVGAWDVITGFAETIGGILDIIVGLFTGNFDKVKEGWKHLWNGIWKILTGILEMILGKIKMVFGIIIGLVSELWKTIWGIISGIAQIIYDWIIKPIWDGICWLFDSIGKGVENVWKGITNIFSNIAGWIYDVVIRPVGDFFAGMWNGLTDGARNAWEGIKNIFGTVASFFANVFGNAWEGVKRIFSTGGQIFSGITQGILEGFKRIVNVIIDGINAVVSIPFNGINTAFNNLRSVDLWGWKPFEWVPQIRVPQIPRLAKGGIINQPGRGVPLGSAFGGERGAEGVIPLTDSQQMALLGEAIGKYITINANITNTMNGRIISRELQKVQNDSDFAYNR